MSDLLLKEIDEELRHDRIKAFWKKYGVLVAGCVAIFVVAIAGWRGYDAWQQSQAANDGDALYDVIKAGDNLSAENQRQLEQLIASGTKGAATLARFRAAGNDKTKALKNFDEIAKDRSLDASLRDLAAMRAAWLAFDQGDLDNAAKRAEPLAQEPNAYRHTARELMALAAYKKKDLPAAARWFDLLIADPAVPGDARNRGEMMLVLIESDGVSADRARLQAPPPKE